MKVIRRSASLARVCDEKQPLLCIRQTFNKETPLYTCVCESGILLFVYLLHQTIWEQKCIIDTTKLFNLAYKSNTSLSLYICPICEKPQLSKLCYNYLAKYHNEHLLVKNRIFLLNNFMLKYKQFYSLLTFLLLFVSCFIWVISGSCYHVCSHIIDHVMS